MNKNNMSNIQIQEMSDGKNKPVECFYTLFTLENIRISNYDSEFLHVKTKLTNFSKR